ncbi:MAG: redoxin domain-containing protein [Candidatus Eisenbacteria bacterium]|uniref:Redoxin domain-containing protein n=1 Tax=Eiseniibacteriota bacterium TaxID=2212470 RepID=A0A9D6LB37_UNCEI|nr:redoxin domain-containing protein [Candidatus Eisenbacteria bacterium]MBI3539399.1 redoxin domain-containing protein [Candidatus Eisenbacteria bacterium]
MPPSATPDVGQPAPEFNLKGPGGQAVTLAEYRGKRHVVLVFYPLAFSPVCSHQLPTIERELGRFTDLDAVVFGVSVDSHWANSAFADRLRLSFPLLSDFRRETSAAYGVLLDAGHSGRAVFVVGKDGRIAYKDVAPTTAEVPDNGRILAALESLR